MGHHIDSEGRFQSDKYPDLPPDKIILSFQDRAVQPALMMAAVALEKTEPELAEDMKNRLFAIRRDVVEP